MAKSVFSDLAKINNDVSGICIGIFGVDITYSHRGGTAFPLTCRTGSEQQIKDPITGISTDEYMTVFEINTQYDTNGTQIFPPEYGVTIGDVITYNGNKYTVSDKKDKSGYNKVFQVGAVRSKAISPGLRSAK